VTRKHLAAALAVLVVPACLHLGGAEPAEPMDAVKKSSDSVCEYVRVALGRPDASAASLGDSKLTWSESTADLPGEMSGATQAEFDFNNDGEVDRVFRRDFEDHYMMGSALLVQPGRSADSVDVASRDPGDDPRAVFFPCQWDAKPIALQSCPPFTQDNDEAGFAMARRGSQKPVFFRARYVDVNPFRFRNHTFVAVTSNSADSADFTAIVEPLADKRFAPKCLLRHGLRIENTW
jgi:hypothetical protein